MLWLCNRLHANQTSYFLLCCVLGIKNNILWNLPSKSEMQTSDNRRMLHGSAVCVSAATRDWYPVINHRTIGLIFPIPFTMNFVFYTYWNSEIEKMCQEIRCVRFTKKKHFEKWSNSRTTFNLTSFFLFYSFFRLVCKMSQHRISPVMPW